MQANTNRRHWPRTGAGQLPVTLTVWVVLRFALGVIRLAVAGSPNSDGIRQLKTDKRFGLDLDLLASSYGLYTRTRSAARCSIDGCSFAAPENGPAGRSADLLRAVLAATVRGLDDAA